MVMYTFCATLAVLLASSAAQFTNPQFPTQQQPTTNFNCPQPTGSFQFPGNCAVFYQCTNSQASVMDCQPGLLFNPNMGYCDWPANVPQCAATNSQQPDLKTTLNNLCTRNPYPQGGAVFLVRNPSYCNSYFTCVQGYMFPQCMFCANSTYFSTTTGMCVSLPAGNGPYTAQCGNVPLVPAEQISQMMITDQCWSRLGQNPMAAALSNINNINNAQFQPNTVNQFPTNTVNQFPTNTVNTFPANTANTFPTNTFNTAPQTFPTNTANQFPATNTFNTAPQTFPTNTFNQPTFGVQATNVPAVGNTQN